jgi:protein-L-isoaspartate O-methyltransferase
MGGERQHWERVYTEHAVDAVSWFEAIPRTSLAMIDALELSLDAPIVDIGGGASRLAAVLAGRGYRDVTVADISAEAMRRAREELSDADRVNWVLADVRDHDFARRFAAWHDRAVFHFMVSAADQHAYLHTVAHSVAPGRTRDLGDLRSGWPDPVQRPARPPL